ncbi:phosphopantothenoylcysteine decarboxylase [Rothia aeria]|uniref:Coenzyme A biosynthesis bifunctional protein CoaBC n=1 Tax=Rothia aeria TaxID=172042 RepID=A0A2Z5R0V0_9MICC|nr:phosphopantothenoylcysteine decarboxylase [Rothia aeria]
MRIIVGIGGGIAAYKAAMLLRLFGKAGHEVIAMPTNTALEFVGKPTLEALSGNPVHTSVFEQVPQVNHVRQAELADAVVIAPATADLLARLASGRADDLLSATVLTTHAPVILAPAMHTQMWEHPATRENVRILRGYGYHLIEPAVGRLTGPDSGVGRLPEPEDIFEAAQRVIAEFPKGKEHPSQTPGYAPTHPVHAGSTEDSDSLSAPSIEPEPGILAGKRIVITAGGTREALDPVRFLGNRSTGKQGVALAQAARDMGASVHLIGANLEVSAPDGVELTRVVSAADLQRAVLKSISGADALVMSAAVADFRPADYAEYKIKKTADPDDNPVIRLVRNPDILREVVQRRQQLGGGPRLIVGFAAETGSPDKTPLELGREKLTRKGCDFLAVNTVGISQGFGTDENTVTLISSLTDEAPFFRGLRGKYHGISSPPLQHIYELLCAVERHSP